jgi:hypothetical protein
MSQRGRVGSKKEQCCEQNEQDKVGWVNPSYASGDDELNDTAGWVDTESYSKRSQANHVYAAKLNLLPPPALSTIFDRLSEEPRCVGITPDLELSGALGLASTCRDLNIFFRYNYITTIRAELTRVICAPESEIIVAMIEPAEINRVLKRFRAVEEVWLTFGYQGYLGDYGLFGDINQIIRKPWTHGSLRTALLGPTNDGRVADSPAKCITRLTIDDAVCLGIGTNDFMAIGSACSSLKVLRVPNNAVATGSGNLPEFPKLAAGAIAGLCRSLSDLDISAWALSKNDCKRISELPLLKQLNMSNTEPSVSSGLWFEGEHIAFAKSLETLILSGSRIMSASVAELLTKLTSLQFLDVTDCPSLDSSILSSLPAKLVRLRVSGSRVISDDVMPKVFASLCELRRLSMYASPISSLRPISLILPHLHELDLTTCPIQNSVLSDQSLSDGISWMSDMKRLTLSCSGVGDLTARAVSFLPNLTCLYMNCDNVSRLGVNCLSSGRARETLQHVTLFNGRYIDEEAVNDLRGSLKHPNPVVRLS